MQLPGAQCQQGTRRNAEDSPLVPVPQPIPGTAPLRLTTPQRQFPPEIEHFIIERVLDGHFPWRSLNNLALVSRTWNAHVREMRRLPERADWRHQAAALEWRNGRGDPASATRLSEKWGISLTPNRVHGPGWREHPWSPRRLATQATRDWMFLEAQRLKAASDANEAPETAPIRLSLRVTEGYAALSCKSIYARYFEQCGSRLEALHVDARYAMNDSNDVWESMTARAPTLKALGIAGFNTALVQLMDSLPRLKSLTLQYLRHEETGKVLSFPSTAALEQLVLGSDCPFSQNVLLNAPCRESLRSLSLGVSGPELPPLAAALAHLPNLRELSCTVSIDPGRSADLPDAAAALTALVHALPGTLATLALVLREADPEETAYAPFIQAAFERFRQLKGFAALPHPALLEGLGDAQCQLEAVHLLEIDTAALSRVAQALQANRSIRTLRLDLIADIPTLQADTAKTMAMLGEALAQWSVLFELDLRCQPDHCPGLAALFAGLEAHPSLKLLRLKIEGPALTAVLPVAALVRLARAGNLLSVEFEPACLLATGDQVAELGAILRRNTVRQERGQERTSAT